MTANDRPLPDPPRSRFGRRIPGEAEGSGPLTADRLAEAAAAGRLEDVLQQEIPEGEHARNLAMMMLGMSGMMPQGMPGALPGMPPASPDGAAVSAAPDTAPAPRGTGGDVAPEVLAATMQGDVAGLMSLLRAEHGRRSGEGSAEGGAPTAAPAPAFGLAADHAPPAASAAERRPGIDQALVDELIRIAADNQVSVDWLLLRAVKIYVEEHRRTGRL